MNHQNFLALGIAGNFTGHLKQAGELEDFKNITTEEESAPKGIFPFYIPNAPLPLGQNPISSDTTNLKPHQTLQIEPEIALHCTLKYDHNKQVTAIIPTHFAAANDCSIRKVQAAKISQKKNWGPSSKGLSTQQIPYEQINQYRLTSFLKRDNQIIQYGEDSAINTYSYFGEKLLNWLINKLNNQQNIGPLENFTDHLKTANYPTQAIIFIGATRYTDQGENLYLKPQDQTYVIAYNPQNYSPEDLKQIIQENQQPTENISLLKQTTKI